VRTGSALTAVSLFSNCGAGDVGFRDAGFEFAAMAELDPRRLEVALLNHKRAKGVSGDLTETWSELVTHARSRLGGTRLDLLAACPPCQGMSSARGDRGKESDPESGSRDARNLLVLPIAFVAEALRPRIIVVENVPAFFRRMVRHPETGEAATAAAILIERLAADYRVFPMLTDLADYGVPQTRKRAFLTFLQLDDDALNSLHGDCSPYPVPANATDHGGSDHVSITQALEAHNLPALDAASSAEVEAGDLPLHAVPVWRDRRYDMVAAIAPGSGDSAWDNSKCPECGHEEVDSETAQCSRCDAVLLRPVVHDESDGYRLVRGFRNSSYRRMAPDLPAATITTASGHVGSDRTIHPTETRVLSTLECALLQGFPGDFDWGESLKKWGHTNVRAMIGEAVPPLFTRQHGQCLVRLLAGHQDTGLLPVTDPRCKRAAEKLEVSRRTASLATST